MRMPMPDGGLYAITDTRNRTDDEFLVVTEALLREGITLLQYRDKQADGDLRRKLGKRLVSLTKQYQVPLIVNDDVQLAVDIDAAGVHLGREDGDIGLIRQRYPDLLLGISCYNDLERAKTAQVRGVDYVAFGAFYPTASKPEAVQANPELLRRAKSVLQCPVVAIGGITPENGASLLRAGADFLAVISGLYAYPDPAARAREYLQLFGKN